MIGLYTHAAELSTISCGGAHGVSVPGDQLGGLHQGGEIFAGVFLTEMPRLMSEVGVGVETLFCCENFFC